MKWKRSRKGKEHTASGTGGPESGRDQARPGTGSPGAVQHQAQPRDSSHSSGLEDEEDLEREQDDEDDGDEDEEDDNRSNNEEIELMNSGPSTLGAAGLRKNSGGGREVR